MAQQFLSRKELLDYRTITSLLQSTNVAFAFTQSKVNRARSSYIQQSDNHLRERDKVLWGYLTDVVQVLVRSTEVLAILPCGERTKATDVIIALRDMKDASTTTDSQNVDLETPPKPRVEFLAASSGALDSHEKIVGAFMLNSRLNFEDHCQVFLRLLREHGEAVGAESRRRTYLRLAVWVFLTSRVKMLNRFRTGQQMRRLWQHLTLSDNDLGQKNSAFLDLMPEQFSAALPTCEQISVMADIFKMKHLARGAFWRAWCQRPVFDRGGRRWLRQVLSDILEDAWQSLNNLNDNINAEKMDELSRVDPSASEFVEKLELLADMALKAYRAILLLCDFQIFFQKEITSIAAWISAIFEIGRTTVDEKQASRFDLRSLRLDDEDEINDDILEIEDLAADPKRGWSHAADRYIELICSHIHALKCLRLSSERTGAKQLVTAYVGKINLRVVGITPSAVDRDDREMSPFDDILRALFTDEEDYTDLREWLLEHKALPAPGSTEWEQPVFAGTVHCETTMLSLIALSLPNDRSFSAISRLEECKQDLAHTPEVEVSESVIQVFQNRGRLLAISKRSCPSCHNLADLIRYRSRTVSNDLFSSAHHAIWHATTLPPWLPRRFAEDVLWNARFELLERLEMILGMVRQKRWKTEKAARKLEELRLVEEMYLDAERDDELPDARWDI